MENDRQSPSGAGFLIEESGSIEQREKGLLGRETRDLADVLIDRIVESCRGATGEALHFERVNMKLTGFVENGPQFFYRIEAQDLDDLEDEIVDIVIKLRKSIGPNIFGIRFDLNSRMVFDNLVFVPAQLTGNPVQIVLNGHVQTTIIAGKKPQSIPPMRSASPAPQADPALLPHRLSSRAQERRAVSTTDFRTEDRKSVRPAPEVVGSSHPHSLRPENARSLSRKPSGSIQGPSVQVKFVAHEVPDGLVQATHFGLEKGTPEADKLISNFIANSILTYRALVELMGTTTPDNVQIEAFFRKLNSPAASKEGVMLTSNLQSIVLCTLIERKYITPMVRNSMFSK